MKPLADSCERNKQPILDVLIEEFANTRKVLEVGSGTGQHAAFFAPRLPHLVWQTSDLEESLAGIRIWLAEVDAVPIPEPLELDAASEQWPDTGADGVFSANTSHIMHWDVACGMIRGVGRQLALTGGGKFCLYGPFNKNGDYTSDSNRTFDGWLKGQDPLMGLRDLDDIKRVAVGSGMSLEKQYRMPANNLILVFNHQGDSGE